MLFNSYEFIFVFLPTALVGFFLFGLVSRKWALGWLILASLSFYAWWRPFNVLIIAPSIVINFVLARTIAQLNERDQRPGLSTTLLVAGILFNVAFLGYFKYINFLRGAINDVFGTELILTHIILPLGISFITFQKIAFLIDVHAGRVKSFTLRDYSLFVLFFPQLIAGPIVHYGEMMPQFQRTSARLDLDNIAVGLTLFFFGLFKKTFLADNIAPFVSPIYEHAGGQHDISLLLSWMAAIGFTLQIYFDFSGYSDMALGVARCFGIRLPANFNSPLKASSIIDFWLRWHMTLTRFLTGYIYNPLVLSLTRRRVAKGLPTLSGRHATLGSFATLLVLPTMLTMFVSGLWHGAGYPFIIWGLLHGAFLSINHGWRLFASRLWPDRASYQRLMGPVGFVATFLAVTTAMVFFRAATVDAALNLLKGMIGLHGVALPQAVYGHIGPLAGWLHANVLEVGSDRDFVMMMAWIAALLLIALGAPNTLEILARFEPALGVKLQPPQISAGRAIAWNASLSWALGVSLIVMVGIVSVSGQSEFLYWQF